MTLSCFSSVLKNCLVVLTLCHCINVNYFVQFIALTLIISYSSRMMNITTEQYDQIQDVLPVQRGKLTQGNCQKTMKIKQNSKMMTRYYMCPWSLILIFALFSCGGCCFNQDLWRVPNLLHPGDMELQRHNMRISDPLPAPGPGMKNSGIRPRDADLPRDPFFSTQSETYQNYKTEFIQP